MPEDVEIILEPGSTPRQQRCDYAAIKKWCTSAAVQPMIRQIRLVDRGGPYLSREEKMKLWRRLIKPGLVKDVLVEGQSYQDIAGCANDAEMPEPVTSFAE